MSTYFSYFPVINYNSEKVKDITRRIIIKSKILKDPYIFLPYTVKEGEKPEDVARLYYGSVKDTWIVLLSNNITDPYEDWYMTKELFDNYLMKKYEELSGEKGFNVILWMQNKTIEENIIYYYKKQGQNIIRINPESYAHLENTTDWQPVRIYDYEFQQNENRKEIILLDNQYKNQITEEIQGLIT